MYIKITYSNGYCGCDEEEYVEVADENEADEYVNEGVYNYGFFDPDSRFIDDCDDEEEYEQELESYQQGCFENSGWEEISKEEYEENT
jgi:hypothetical protein